MVHGDIGVAHEVVGARRVGVRECDTDRHRDAHGVVADLERLLERVDDPMSHAFRLGASGDGLHHDELIAAVPHRGRFVADGLFDAPGDGDHQLVADFVPVGVVDQFEAVEIAEQRGDVHRRVVRRSQPTGEHTR